MLGLTFIWIVYQGYLIIFKSKDATEVFTNAVKIFVCLILIISWGTIYSWIIEPMLNGPSEIISNVTGNSDNSIISNFISTIMTAIYNSFGNFSVWDIGISIIVGLIIALVLFGVVVSIGYYFYLIIKSKLIIALMLIISPIFIMFATFESTKSYFNQWFNVILSQAFTLILISLNTQLTINIIVESINKVTDVKLPTLATLTLIGFSLLISILMFGEIQKVSAQIAQGSFGGGGINLMGIVNFFRGRFKK